MATRLCPERLPPGHPPTDQTAMKTVAVLGGGPAGSFAAERLASAGLQTIVFDEKLAWEKPCGGGLTYKAYQQYPFLIDNDTPKKLIHDTTLAAPNAGEVKMPLSRPLVIYSRLDLNRMLLLRAEKAGAAIEKTRVLSIERRIAAGVCAHKAEWPRRTFALSPRARAIRCAKWAPSGARKIP